MATTKQCKVDQKGKIKFEIYAINTITGQKYLVAKIVREGDAAIILKALMNAVVEAPIMYSLVRL